MIPPVRSWRSGAPRPVEIAPVTGHPDGITAPGGARLKS